MNYFIPESVNFQLIADDLMSTLSSWGVSVTGVSLYNAISPELSDPYYPTSWSLSSEYAEEESPEFEEEEIDIPVEYLDSCFGHSLDGLFHYHLPSPCIPDSDYYSAYLTYGRLVDDVIETFKTSY